MLVAFRNQLEGEEIIKVLKIVVWVLLFYLHNELFEKTSDQIDTSSYKVAISDDKV